MAPVHYFQPGETTMGTTQDKQLEIQKIQSKIDALQKKRDEAFAAAVTERDQACRRAADQYTKTGNKIMAKYDPKIDDLEDKREAAGGVKRRKPKKG